MTAHTFTGETPTQRALTDAAASVGPFMDGDGNVYSIEPALDPDADEFLALKCAAIDGTVTRVRVTSTDSGLTAAGIDGSASIFRAKASGGFSAQGNDAAGNSWSIEANTNLSNGLVFTVTPAGESAAASIALTANGVLIDGVLVDPTQPWPGA